jgi:hypothetical protein
LIVINQYLKSTLFLTSFSPFSLFPYSLLPISLSNQTHPLRWIRLTCASNDDTTLGSYIINKWFLQCCVNNYVIHTYFVLILIPLWVSCILTSGPFYNYYFNFFFHH